MKSPGRSPGCNTRSSFRSKFSPSPVKKPALFEGRFEIEKLGDLSPREEMNLILSFLMLVLRERRRG